MLGSVAIGFVRCAADVSLKFMAPGAAAAGAFGTAAAVNQTAYNTSVCPREPLHLHAPPLAADACNADTAHAPLRMQSHGSFPLALQTAQPCAKQQELCPMLPAA